MSLRARSTLAVSVLSLISCLVSPSDVSACGGTFCDGPTPSNPTPMPVDQSGENILFVLDGENVEAHIQIQYTGDPARFAWIIPVQKVPTVEVGSQLFFSSLLAGSVPTFTTQASNDICPGQVRSAGSGAGCSFGASDDDDATGAFGPGSGGTGGASGSGGAGGADPGVEKKVVGAFDVSILEQKDPLEVITWLNDNHFQVTQTTAPLIASYVDQGYVFVAVRLTPGQGTDEIHPIVLRYPGNKPCVPLKLTAVAATEDMAVRTFFLGERRVMPTNYKHVVPSEAHFDWINLGSNYDRVISRAVDSPVANGRAFVTEYAGTSDVVTNDSPHEFFSAAWHSNSFRDAAPEDVVSILENQRLVSCSGSSCTSPHPLIFPLLEQYVPVPSGVDAGSFYTCVSCYKSQIDLEAWDADKFADDFEARIVGPGRHAESLLNSWSYLTRMLTTISPAEMTEDPEFAEQSGLPDVSPQHVATLRTACSGATGYETSDGVSLASPSGSSWPTLDDVPYAAVIQDSSVQGSPATLVDNSEKINGGITSYNAGAWPPAETFYIRPESDCDCSLPHRRRSAPLALVLMAAGSWIARRLSARAGQAARADRAGRA